MTDVYKVGVSLVMSGNFAQVLGALSQNLLGISKQVDQLQGKFTGLKLAITGALGAYAGTKVLETMGTMVKYGDQLVHQQNLLAAAGAKQQEIAEATALAYRTSAQVQTSNTAEVMKHIREMRYAFGRMPSEAVTREVEYANAGMQAVGGHDYSDQVWDLVKSEEMTNRMAEPEFIHALHLMQQVYNASGGKVTPQQFFQAFKYGRTAAASWNDEFIGGALGRAIQNLGGGSGGGGGRAGPGNALMSAYAAVVGDQTTRKAAQAFAGLGMYHNHQVSGSELFAENPYEWVQQILMPALAQKGITDPNKVRAELERIFPNRTASQIIAEFATQGRYMMGEENSLYEKDIRLQHEGMFGELFYKLLMDKDYQTNLKAFTEQWNSLMQAVGAAIVPTAISYMRSFTDTFTAWTQTAKDNPELIANLGKGLGILGTALVGGGAVALLAAFGPAGWIATGIIGLGAAIITYGPQIDQWFNSFRDKLKKFFGIGGSPIQGPYDTGDYHQKLTLQKIHDALVDKNTAAINDNTQQLKDLNEQLSKSPIGGIGYYGPGIGGGGLINAAYTPGGGGYGIGLAPFHSGGGYAVGGNVASAPGFGGGGGTSRIPNAGANPMGDLGGGFNTNFMHGQFGGPGQNLTTITAGGKSFRVNSAAAPYFKGFVDDLAAAGAPINSIGGYVNKNIAGTGHISQHAFGNAIDIDQLSKNNAPALHAWAMQNPDKFRSILRKHGIVSGGDWRSADFGHFEWGGPVASTGPIATGSGATKDALFAGAKAAGMDYAHFAAMASIESSLNPSSNYNKGTQYKGLFQIGREEWAKYGHGNIYNAHDNAMAMAGLINAHRAEFRARFGREPTVDELYMAHQQGMGFFTHGAMTNIGGNPYPGMRGPQSHDSFMKGWSRELERRSGEFSPVPPHDSDNEIHVHHTSMLDGRVVAKNTMKHMVKMGNGRVSGARLADYSGTRPAEV